MKLGIRSTGKVSGARLIAAALLALALGLGAAPAWAQGTPAVTVADQAVQDSTVMVASVTAAQDGWIVIHESKPDGTVLAPDSIGQGAVKAGANIDVKVTLQKQVEVGAKLWAMLHIDAGTLGTYEFPGADTPVSVDGAVVMQPFMITAAQPQPTTEPTAQPTTEPTAAPEPPAAVEDSVTVADQMISGNTVVIAMVSASRDGWLVIHESKPDGTVLAPDSIGQTAVKAGMTENVSVTLNKQITSSERLWAMLHVDAGTAGTYEFPGPDAPVTVDGQVVMQPFEATWEGAVTGPAPAPAPAPGMPRTGAGFGPEFFVAAALVATALFGGGLAARRKAARARK